VLARCGIDPKRYWLLVDLFSAISERGEIMDQLGWSGAALKMVAWVYLAISAFLTLLMTIRQPPLGVYSATFLAMTAFLMPMVLVSEAGNSLVNPIEGLVLAHQPIAGATYIAAKLSHLVRIVLYIVPALNIAPALAGLFLKDAGWRFPLVHMALALGLGLLAALFCCVLFGWLLRFVPVPRLKSAAQIASAIPWLAAVALDSTGVFKNIRIERWIPPQPAVRWGAAAALTLAALAVVMLGIRALSADFLIRVSAIAHGNSRVRAKTRRPRVESLVARFCGGPGARAAFAYVSTMARRDFQFRRQLAQVLPGLLVGLLPAFRHAPPDPFSGKFTFVHLVPHLCGIGFLVVCSILPYGNDHKGAWLFQLAPLGIFRPFARGVYAFLWYAGILIPNAILFLVLVWLWGIWHATLFALFSVAAASTYLSLTLRVIDTIPFTRKLELTRGAILMPLMILTVLAAAIGAALQHFIIFHSEIAVLLTTAALIAISYFLTRSSLTSLEANIRYTLDLFSGESALLYKEIEA
jgi:hypothetical protein